MKVWHYALEDLHYGPVSTEELSELLNQGKLTENSLIWKEGMAEWAAIRTVPLFPAAVSPYVPPTVDSNDAIQWDDYTPTGSQVRPWIRFWARVLDMCILGILVGVIAYFVYPPYEDMPDYLSGILLTAFMVPAEAVMLSVFGTTPSKAILNIRVRNRNGSRLDFQQALLRSVRVWIRGAGLGLPLISLITYYSSYKNLSESGIVSWDREGGHLLSHRTIGWWRILVIFSVFVGLIALISYLEENGGG